MAGCKDDDPKPAAHSVGGTISGLTGSGLIIDLTVLSQSGGSASPGVPVYVAPGATTFTAQKQLYAGNSYILSVRTQPSGQQCTFANAGGIMPSADVRNAVLTCSTTVVVPTGTVSGLSAGGLILANGTDNVAVPGGATSFSLPAVASGGSWNIVIKAQPTGQTCTVVNGSGQAGNTSQGAIAVNCVTATPTTYSIGGTVSGMVGSLVLVNGTDSVGVDRNGTFTFPGRVSSGVAYSVAVSTLPVAMSCLVANATGTVGSTDVANVNITCDYDTFTVGGTITGLTTAGLVLTNGNDNLSVAANARAFTMGQPVMNGVSYSLGVRTQPSGLNCTVARGSGTVTFANVTNASVTCVSLGPQVTTLAGTGVAGFADGGGSAAQFNRPAGLVADAAGNIYLADENNNRIRKIAPNGTVTTLAGDGTRGYADGPVASSRFDLPLGVAVDGAGNVFVVDRLGQRIRKITPSGTVSTLAGNGTAGFADGVGTAAQFSTPSAIAIDGAGNLYVSDTDNHRIRKILPDGTVSTIAGSGVQGFADGSASTAQFNTPYGIAIDNSLNLYVADLLNHRIRKISLGAVSTVAGSVSGYAEGVGSAAKFNNPYGVAVNAGGDLFVADFGNSRIRKVAADGTVSTIAGTGVSGFADGNAATAQFAAPLGIAVDASGNVLVGDFFGHRVRKITR